MGNFIDNLRTKEHNLLTFFNHSIRCKTLDMLMPLFTNLASSFFIIFFCITCLVYPNPTVKSFGLKCTISVAISNLIVQIIKRGVGRQRPFFKLPNLYIKKIGIDDYSFPSGHTTNAFSMGIMLSLFLPKLSVLFIIVALIVGISRMYLGVHYPSDVLVGIILGSSVSILIFNMIK